MSACTAWPTGHWVNVSCLLGVLTGHICVLHITRCEDIKTVAQLIESKDDLVTVDHLTGRKSWHSEVSEVANLAGEDAVDIKNGFHHIKIHSHYLSTVQRSYLLTLITKAIDTTSNSYQPLWLRCWRGEISSFFTKKLDSSSFSVSTMSRLISRLCFVTWGSTWCDMHHSLVSGSTHSDDTIIAKSHYALYCYCRIQMGYYTAIGYLTLNISHTINLFGSVTSGDGIMMSVVFSIK